MKNLGILMLLTLLSSFAMAGQPDHSIWNRFLAKHVSAAGTVNYTAMKIEMDSLDAYLLELRNNAPGAEWSQNERLAYYINGYNAYTVKFILSKLPAESVKDISFSGKDLWSFKMAVFGSTSYTLKQIEDEILRKMSDARIHFAINCGATSCPRLANEAYLPEKMNAQLAASAKAFINDPKHNIISEKKVQLSEIFLWYATDFTWNSKTLIEFLNQYSNVTIRSDAKIEYLPYDWSLND